MWATPGPYLRRTTLEILAKKASDIVLPEVFWKMVTDTTFQESESSPQYPSEASWDLVGKQVSPVYKLQTELARG